MILPSGGMGIKVASPRIEIPVGGPGILLTLLTYLIRLTIANRMIQRNTVRNPNSLALLREGTQ